MYVLLFNCKKVKVPVLSGLPTSQTKNKSLFSQRSYGERLRIITVIPASSMFASYGRIWCDNYDN